MQVTLCVNPVKRSQIEMTTFFQRAVYRYYGKASIKNEEMVFIDVTKLCPCTFTVKFHLINRVCLSNHGWM